MANRGPRSVRGNCPKCKIEANAYVRKEYAKVSSSTRDDPTWAENKGFILECAACNTIYFRHEFTFSEWGHYGTDQITGETTWETPSEVEHWPPAASRRKPPWMNEVFDMFDGTLTDLLNEIYAALDGGSQILAAIGIRTAFEHTCTLMGISEGGFARKLELLHGSGKIGSEDADALGVLTDAGNAAAHRGWKPEPHELSLMIDALEHFINKSINLNPAMNALKQRVPKRKSQ